MGSLRSAVPLHGLSRRRPARGVRGGVGETARGKPKRTVNDATTDNLMTAEQAAEYLNVPVSSVAWLCRTRKLAYAVIARKRRFRKRDLDKYVAANVVEAV